MTKISYSAPGKIILSGEHSVVYAKPALVTAIDMRLTCTIKSTFSKGITYEKQMQFCIDTTISYLKSKKINYKKRDFTYSITSNILRGHGMGSSAAYCVAVSACLYQLFTGTVPTSEVSNSIAFMCEKHFHGMPSGVDVSAASFGGLIYYRKEFEFLKHISALNFKIPTAIQDRLILIDSGKPAESTTDMVKHVGMRYNDHPHEMETALNVIEKTTRRMVISIVKEDAGMFAQSIKDNGAALFDVGIVSKKTQSFICSLSSFGVGKVTGAGGITKGSGLILFFLNDSSSIQDLTKEGVKIIPFVQSHMGLRRE
jgi:mevalonate kinase